MSAFSKWIRNERNKEKENEKNIYINKIKTTRIKQRMKEVKKESSIYHKHSPKRKITKYDNIAQIIFLLN